MILKVGRDVIKDRKSGKYRKLSYIDLHHDHDKWIDSSKYLPDDYDLLFLKTKEGVVKTGWISGIVWDGSQIKDGEKFISWKKKVYKLEEVNE